MLLQGNTAAVVWRKLQAIPYPPADLDDRALELVVLRAGVEPVAAPVRREGGEP